MGKQRRFNINPFKRKNNKQIRYSVSLKLTLIVALLSILIILSISIINFYIQLEREKSQNELESQKKFLGFVEYHSVFKNIDDYLTSNGNLNDTDDLQSYITDLRTEINENGSIYFRISRINIYKFSENKLQIYASTQENNIGSVSKSKFNNESFQKGESIYKIDEEEYILTIFSPIIISNKIVGTYEIDIFMPCDCTSHEEQIKTIILVSFIGIILLIVSILFLLKKIIVNPIIDFKNKSEKIAKGYLDTKIDINSNDEIGELANAFNKMVKSLEESRGEIEYYNKILQQLLEQKDKFIGQLGHDLKNPLQPIVGLLPILIDQEKDPKKKETLKVMNQNVEYMKDLIIDTLKLARLRTDNIEFDFEKLNLKSEIRKILSSQTINLIEKNIRIENRVDESINVWADKLRLSEIFQNLISNSVKYMPNGGGLITISTEKENGMVKVIIRDTGIGMTREQLNNIFNEFYKKDTSTSDYHSTGLGLAITKRIVEKHGGKIWAESPGPGKGSTFYFTLKIVI